MKKSLLILGVTALVFAGCSDVDVKTDIQNDFQNSSNEVISFTSFTNKITRAENSKVGYDWAFYEHQPDFLVWGYKDNADDPVFNGNPTNDIVVAQRSGDAAPYTYTFANTPLLRFWDKSPERKYEFYAAAPATLKAGESWTFTPPTNAEKSNGYFTTTSTLTGVNLQQSSPSATPINTFKNKADYDKLIAAPCSGNYVYFSEAVSLHFIHILSKMNVTVRKDGTLLPDDKYTVKLKKVEIKGLNATGTFTEGASAYTAAATGSNDRWGTLSGSVDYSFTNNEGVTLSSDASNKVNFIESLVIPQTVTPTQTIGYDGKILDGSYADAAEFNAGHGLSGADALDATAFAALPAGAKVKPAVYASVDDYNTAKNQTLDATAFAALNLEQKAKYVYETGSGAEPYFVIEYTILYNGNTNPEPFKSYHNLGSSFKGNETALYFYEGYQNTFNITILPDAIEFCADIAGWDDNTKVIDETFVP